MSFTRDEKGEIEMLVKKRQEEIETEQSGAPHSNQQLLEQENDLLESILEKLSSMAGGRRRRRQNRKTRKGTRKN